MKTILKRLFIKVRKTGPIKNYVFYALGEIILIVLSLLLALQLNELNQKRKNNRLRQSYYKSLVEDYQTDLEQIRMAQKSFQNELDRIDEFGRRLNSSLATDDTLVNIARNEFNPNIPPFVTYTTTTTETLKETGHLELLGNEILRQMNSLKALHQEQESYQNITLESHARLLENYLSNYPLKNGVITKGTLHEKLWDNIDVKDLTLEFNGLLTISRSILVNATSYYQKIANDTEQSIALLKAKIQ